MSEKLLLDKNQKVINMNKIFRIPSMFLAASVLMLAGCVNEKDGNEGLINTNGNLVIRFTVDGSTSQDTKAALPKQTGKTFFNETEDGDQLFLIRTGKTSRHSRPRWWNNTVFNAD